MGLPGQAQDLPLHISDINIKGNESEENHSNLDILTTLKKGQKICKDFNQYQFEDGSRASCSGGIVMCGDDQKPTSEHIERADKSLYKAKREKKGNCCMWKK